ncbi:hypothetical protein LCGC14_1770530 [marine sediment metagenome]|uniref:Uncharacterized protein n=1 Tax=marine sediment metagenome TaxID=412755 RepID=A0A0F9GYH3_9ZZZZ
MEDQGWTVTVWVDTPGEWNAERVREEVDTIVRYGWGGKVKLNTVYTPKREGND